MSEHDGQDHEKFKNKLMETVKKLRELLRRLPFDFDQNQPNKTKEIIIPKLESDGDEDGKIERGVTFEIEDVGQHPVHKVCRLISRRNDVVTIYSVAMREYQHAMAQDGKFSNIFWASARLDEKGNPTMINGAVLPFITTDGLRFIPIDEQLDDSYRTAKVDITDVEKIGEIVEAVRKTLPPPDGEIGATALRLVR
jgi:hypothetical protein